MTVAERKGERVDRARRAPAGRHHARALAALRPIMARSDPEATVTAGNASGQNDGAAVCIVTHRREGRRARACGRSRGWSSWAVAGVPPRDDGHRPGPGDRSRAASAPAWRSRDIGPDRAQRGVRRAGARLLARVGSARRPGARQRQRLGHLARPPRRRDRRAHPGHAAARDGAGAARATAWRRCASAAARAWRRCSRTSPPQPPERLTASAVAGSEDAASATTSRGQRPSMTGVLYGLAQFCVRRRFVVLAVWLLATIALVAVSHRLGDNTNDNLSLPGTDSQRATTSLEKSFPNQANGSSPIVLHANSGKLTDAKNAEAVEQGRRRRRQGAERRVGRQPAHAAGRGRAEQGQDDRLPVGHALASAPASCRSDEVQKIIERRRPRQGRRAARCRPAASSARRSPSPPPSPAS